MTSTSTNQPAGPSHRLAEIKRDICHLLAKAKNRNLSTKDRILLCNLLHQADQVLRARPGDPEQAYFQFCSDVGATRSDAEWMREVGAVLHPALVSSRHFTDAALMLIAGAR